MAMRTQNSSLIFLYAARAVRGFGDGFALIILPVYLSAIGFDAVQIGFVATAALLGSALTTMAIGFVAARYDLRNLLFVSAIFMAVTGLLLPASMHLAFILVVVFIGTINPSSSDTGMIVPIEHAMLAHEASDRERTKVFSRYSLTGALSMAAGSLAAALPTAMIFWGLEKLLALTMMFYFYAALGIVGVALYSRLPHARSQNLPAVSSPLGPSRLVVYKLAALFSLDAFAGGFAVQSLLALWLFEKFGLSLTAASLFFFWSNVLSAFSYPVAARLAGRFGLVNTMVFTHIPSSIFLILAAFSQSIEITLGLLLVRSALSQMDVPTRTSYVMAVVTPAERAAAASFTAVPRSLASSLSPALAGFLFSLPFSGIPLVVCGSLKIIYDISLLFSFRHIKPPEEDKSPV